MAPQGVGGSRNFGPSHAASRSMTPITTSLSRLRGVGREFDDAVSDVEPVSIDGPTPTPTGEAEDRPRPPVEHARSPVEHPQALLDRPQMPPPLLPPRSRRVSLPCQRCKSRKQRCDGSQPTCGPCHHHSMRCVYPNPPVKAKKNRIQQTQALESRVAELEEQLAVATAVAATAAAKAAETQPGGPSVSRSISPGMASTGPVAHAAEALGTPAPLSPPAEVHAAPGQHHVPDEDDQINDAFVAIRDLSLSASGQYIGGSSGIALGRILGSILRRKVLDPNLGGGGQTACPTGEGHADLRPRSSMRISHVLSVPSPSFILAEKLRYTWLTHLAPRYPVLHTPQVPGLLRSRYEHTDPYKQSVAHLVYAISGRWLQSSGEDGEYSSDEHYDAALQVMDAVLSLNDMRTLDYLILMAIYCMRSARKPGAWTYIGAAMRLCVELGLHRKQKFQAPTLISEMNKRRFWTAYLLDRDISTALGRPPSISDHDIDADLPMDMDEAAPNEAAVRQAFSHVSPFPRQPPTTLTPFVHRLRLKRIESEIQHAIYRVDDRHADVSDEKIGKYLDRLHRWNEQVRPVAECEMRDYEFRQTQQSGPYRGPEIYTIPYRRCVRFLLYPRLGRRAGPVNPKYLRLCAEACAGLLQDYRSLHAKLSSVALSALSVQTIFIAGLTLIYCAWLAPPNSLDLDSALANCWLLLNVVAERYSEAGARYRDLFDTIRSSVMPAVSSIGRKPRTPVAIDLLPHGSSASSSSSPALSQNENNDNTTGQSKINSDVTIDESNSRVRAAEVLVLEESEPGMGRAAADVGEMIGRMAGRPPVEVAFNASPADAAVAVAGFATGMG